MFILFVLFFVLYCFDMYFINKDVLKLTSEINSLRNEIVDLKIKNIEKE